ncbi:hypothetical protein Clacol_005760 [Clathrus columnatus]|uniref:AAA+ ATPase domain-containing protein n=1 Tax=Clathrus columnatus TaxID=1419009 RepID=A0AAV5ACV9_9AGAM|nr:hypothetical protein Clacol_005760 [Clathrus columnatus]
MNSWFSPDPPSYPGNSHGSWRWNGARQKRPMSSIVLEPGIKEMILNDCKDFLQSEEWYAERGIPFRRGYLLHGVPGSGKTSLIHSLAGELGLDIYVVSLSSKGMSDNMLGSLMGDVPSRCIVLLEDLDAAFTRGVTRDANSTGAPITKETTTTTTNSTATAENKDNAETGNTLSLSGLLNSLDGVAAAEGRLLFATTNHIERLDPALSRPGRMDVWVNFSNASKWQARGIFKCFFPYKQSETVIPDDKEKNNEPSSTGSDNLPVPRRKAVTHNIPCLSEEELDELAERFSQAIPDDEFSVASLQGYLLKNKTRPRESVGEVSEWIIKEREIRAKLKKDKEEKEAREKKEAEEKAAKEAKEKAEKEAKEKAEKEKETKDASKVESEKTEVSPPSNVPADSDQPSEAAMSANLESTLSECDVESVSAEDDTTKSPMSSGSSSEKWVAVSSKQPESASS